MVYQCNLIVINLFVCRFFFLKLKETKYDDPHYGLVDNGDYQSAMALANGASNLYAFRLQQQNLHQGTGGYGSSDLTLA